MYPEQYHEYKPDRKNIKTLDSDISTKGKALRGYEEDIPENFFEMNELDVLGGVEQDPSGENSLWLDNTDRRKFYITDLGLKHLDMCENYDCLSKGPYKECKVQILNYLANGPETLSSLKDYCIRGFIREEDVESCIRFLKKRGYIQ